MDGSVDVNRVVVIHPVFAFLLAGAVPLYLGGLISDLTYANTAQPQWSNFAQWLIAAAMVFTGFALLCALITLFRVRRRWGWPLLCFVLLLATFAFGLIDSFVHAIDAWGIMPGALIYSAIVTLLALLSTFVGFSRLRTGDPR